MSSQGATIDGNVGVEQNAQLAAFSGTTIGGNLHCNQCEVADLHESTVNGNLEDTAVSEGAFIQNSQIGGSLHIHHGTDFFGTGFHIDMNTIAGNMVFDQNTGASDILNNQVQGNLRCQGNNPPPVGAGNTAKSKGGQCAAL